MIDQSPAEHDAVKLEEEEEEARAAAPAGAELALVEEPPEPEPEQEAETNELALALLPALRCLDPTHDASCTTCARRSHPPPPVECRLAAVERLRLETRCPT